MPREEKRYFCEICNNEYKTYEDAKSCEEYKISESHYKVGDIVNYSFYGMFKITKIEIYNHYHRIYGKRLGTKEKEKIIYPEPISRQKIQIIKNELIKYLNR